MPAPHPPLVLYSTNTSLAYNLNQHYYGGKHWVWCNPLFDERAALAAGAAAPPSSMPLDIYRVYTDAIVRGDYHSALIESNRFGLRTGAKAKLGAGKITAAQYRRIINIIRDSELSEFSPMIYVIPFAMVAKRILPVDPAAAANPFSAEFKILSLDRSQFDIIRP